MTIILKDKGFRIGGQWYPPGSTVVGLDPDKEDAFLKGGYATPGTVPVDVGGNSQTGKWIGGDWVPSVLAFQDGPYTSWPTKAEHDTTRGKDVVLYNSGTDHASADQRVYCRTRTPGGSWSNPVLVSSGVSGFTHCDGLIVTPEGIYYAVVITRSGDGSTAAVAMTIRRSADGGANWTNLGQVTLQGAGTNLVPAYGGHWFRSSTGAFLFLFCSASSQTTWVMRTTEANPTVWSQSAAIDRTAVGSPSLLCEGRMFENTATGQIVCIARRNIDGVYTTSQRPVFAVSSDDGITWSAAWAYCTPTTAEMTNNNLAGWYNPATGSARLFWGSRFQQGDGYGSLFESTPTWAELVAGNLGTPRRITRGASNRDYGYPGVIRRPDGSFSLFAYNGNATNTKVYELSPPA